MQYRKLPFYFQQQTLLSDFYKITKADPALFEKVEGDADTLASFILDHSTPGGVYPETYQPNGNFSDVGNQEHASWQHYSMSCANPLPII